MSTMTDRDARLRQFFAGYFQEDWAITGGPSWRDVVVGYVAGNPRERVLVLIDDLRAWLDAAAVGGPSSVAGYGCHYECRPELTEPEWVGEIVDVLSERLASS